MFVNKGHTSKSSSYIPAGKENISNVSNNLALNTKRYKINSKQ